MAQRKGTGVLLGIALFKLVKAVALIAVGIAALTLDHDPARVTSMRRFVIEAGIDPNHRVIELIIGKVSGMSPHRMEALGVGVFTYAAVFLVEGTGLLLRKRWAEYLTSIVTASFIPFEVYELAHEPSVLKVLGLVVNALIVVYLVIRLWREHREASK